MRAHQVVVPPERLLVGFHGVGRLTRLMVGQPQIVPGLRVGREQGGRQLEFFDGQSILSLIKQMLSLQQRAGAGWSAAPEENRAERRQEEKRVLPERIFDGLHQWRWKQLRLKVLRNPKFNDLRPRFIWWGRLGL